MILRLVLGFCFICFVNCYSGESKSVFEETSTLPQCNCTDASKLHERSAQLKDKVIASDENGKSSDDNVKKIVQRSTEERVQVNSDNSTAGDDSRRSFLERSLLSYEPILRPPNHIPYDHQDLSLHVNVPVLDSQNLYLNIVDNALYNKMQDKLLNFNSHTTTATGSDDCLPIKTVTYIIKEILQFVKQNPDTLNLIINEIEDDINEKPPMFWFQGGIKTDIKSLLIRISQLNRFHDTQQPECSASVVSFLEQRPDILSELRKKPRCLHLSFGCHSEIVHQEYSRTTEQSYCKKIKDLMEEPYEKNIPNSHLRPLKYVSKEVHSPDSHIHMPDLNSQEAYILHTPELSIEMVRPQVTQNPEFIINDGYEPIETEYEFSPSEFKKPDIYMLSSLSKLQKPKEHVYPKSIKFPGTFETVDTGEPKPIYVEDTEPIYVEKPEHGYTEEPESIYTRPSKFIDTEKHVPLYIEKPEVFYVHEPESFYIQPSKFIDTEKRRPVHVENPESNFIQEPESIFIQPFKIIDIEKRKPLYVEHETFNIEEPETVHVKPKPILIDQPKPNYIEQPEPNYNGQVVPNYIDKPEPNYIQHPEPNYIQHPEPNFKQHPEPNYIQPPESNYIQYPEPNYIQHPEPNYIHHPEPNYIQNPEPNYVEQPELKFKPKFKPNDIEQPESKYVLKPTPIIVEETESTHIKYPKFIYTEKPSPIYIEKPEYIYVNGLDTIHAEYEPINIEKPEPIYMEEINYFEKPKHNYTEQHKPIYIDQLESILVDQSEPKSIYVQNSKPNVDVEKPESIYVQQSNPISKPVHESEPFIIIGPESIYIEELKPDVTVETIHTKKNVADTKETPKSMKILTVIEEELVDSRAVEVLLKLLNQNENNNLTPSQVEKLLILIKPNNQGLIPQKHIDIASTLIHLDTVKYLSQSSIDIIFSLIPNDIENSDVRAIDIIHEILLQKQIKYLTKQNINHMLSILRNGSTAKVQNKRLDFVLFILRNMAYAPKLVNKLLKISENSDIVQSKYWDVILYLHKRRLLNYKLLEALTTLLTQETTGNIDPLIVKNVFLILESYKNDHPNLVIEIHNILYPEYTITPNINMKEVPENLKDLLYYLMNSSTSQLANDQVPDIEPLQTHYIWQENNQAEDQERLQANLLKKILEWEQNHNSSPKPRTQDYGLIELTYRLKHHKPLLYHPVYYVKYKMPMVDFLTKVKELLTANPQLTANPAKLLQELIIDGNISAISPDLKGVPKEDILRLTFNGGNLIQTKIFDDKSLNLNEQIQLVHNLNSDITPQEILQQNAINEAQYYTNVQQSESRQVNMGIMNSLRNLGNIGHLLPYKVKDSPSQGVNTLNQSQGFNAAQYGTNVQITVPSKLNIDTMSSLRNMGNIGQSLPYKFKGSSSQGIDTLNQPQGFNAVQYYSNVQENMPSQLNVGTMSSSRNIGNIGNLLPFKFKESSSQGVNMINQSQVFNAAQYGTNMQISVPSQVNMSTMNSLINIGNIDRSLANKFKDSSLQGVNTLNQPQGFNAAQYYTNVQESVPSHVNIGTMSSVRNVENIPNRFKDSSSQRVNTLNQPHGFNAAQYYTNVQESVPSHVNIGTMSSVRNVENIPNRFKDSSSQGVSTLNQPHGFNAAQYYTYVQESVPSNVNIGTMSSVRNVENIPNRFKDSSLQGVNTLNQPQGFNAAQYYTNVQASVPSHVNIGNVPVL